MKSIITTECTLRVMEGVAVVAKKETTRYFLLIWIVFFLNSSFVVWLFFVI